MYLCERLEMYVMSANTGYNHKFCEAGSKRQLKYIYILCMHIGAAPLPHHVQMVMMVLLQLHFHVEKDDAL